MAFDGIIAKQVVKELQSCLIGGKINKVMQPNKNELYLVIYSHGKNYTLNISIASGNYRIHLTNSLKSNPITPPHFCMVLRKHLTGFKIDSITMNGLERIIYISLVGYNELNDFIHKTLVVELMGKHSNILLLNESGFIIDSLRHLEIANGATRDIMPARKYILPPSHGQDFLHTSLDEFEQVLEKEENIADNISHNYTGISKCFVDAFLSFQHLPKTYSNYSPNQIKNLYASLQETIIQLDTISFSCEKTENDYCLCLNPSSNTLAINAFLDTYYTQKEAQEFYINYRNQLLKSVLQVLKKTQKKLSSITEKIQECKNMDAYRIYGELITANLYRIEDNKNRKEILLENYYDNNKIISIPLDESISPSYNAKKYFKKYHKLKNTLAFVNLQKKEVEIELDYLESVAYEIENAEDLETLEDIEFEIQENVLFQNTPKSSTITKKKPNKRKSHETYEPLLYSIDGFPFYIGKNNKQNDYISTKLGKNEDLWFHTKDIRSSHGILKCNGNKVEEKTILSCAQLIALHSKAKLSSNVPVDYCFAKFVKKTSGSKPGMVIYTNYKTIYVSPKNISDE